MPLPPLHRLLARLTARRGGGRGRARPAPPPPDWIDHPAIRAMSPRELDDLPAPRDVFPLEDEDRGKR